MIKHLLQNIPTPIKVLDAKHASGIYVAVKKTYLQKFIQYSNNFQLDAQTSEHILGYHEFSVLLKCFAATDEILQAIERLHNSSFNLRMS